VGLSIRRRLTLWNLSAMAVVLVGFAALVYALTARALYRQLDDRLLAGFRQLERDSRLATQRDERLRYWLHELYEHETILAAVYGPDGPLAHTEELASEAVPPLSGDTSPGLRFRDQVVPTLGRQRVLEGRLEGHDLTLVLMAPLEGVDHELGRLRAALAVAVPVGLAFSGLAGYLLARKALAPVERLRRQTREITADRLNRRLEVGNPGDELGGLALTINEMIGRLERSFTEIRRFTADASHELRTPLAALRAEAEVALSRPDVPPEQQFLLGSILEECERLGRLTDQLLTLAREDAGVGPPLVQEEVNLAALVAGVTETMRPLADARAVRLHFTGKPVTVRGDPARLRQVFYNLVDNAIKYTPEGGTVQVEVESSGGSAIASVRDTGVGIAAEHLPHVFERFYRVDKARSREEGGTGLGLSIARSIIAAHGGRIDLESQGPGRGTTARVELPLGPADG
jgi:heavy metal sensor kinase